MKRGKDAVTENNLLVSAGPPLSKNKKANDSEDGEPLRKRPRTSLSDVTHRVRFDDGGTEYYPSDGTNATCAETNNGDNGEDDEAEKMKQRIWYNEEELAQFRSNYDDGGQMLYDSAPERFEQWRDVISKIYKSKQSAAPAAVANQLAQLYKEAPEMVGLEYMALTTACLTDLASRNELLQKTIESTYKTKTKSYSPARARRVLSASRKLSKTSQLFATKLAQAQAQALGH